MWNCCLVRRQGRLVESTYESTLHHVATALTTQYSSSLVCHPFGLTGKDGSSEENLPIGPVEASLAEYERKGRRANADVFVKAMTDGETTPGIRLLLCSTIYRSPRQRISDGACFGWF